MSQEAGNKPVVLAMALKDKTMEGIQALREVIRSCQVWWSCAIWIQGNDLESMTHHHLFKRTRNENDGMSLCWFWMYCGISWIFLYCVEHLWVLLLWQVCSPYSQRWDENNCLNMREKYYFYHIGWDVYLGNGTALRLCPEARQMPSSVATLYRKGGTPSAEWIKETLTNLILPVFFFALWKSLQLKYKPQLQINSNCIIGKIFLPIFKEMSPIWLLLSLCQSLSWCIFWIHFPLSLRF